MNEKGEVPEWEIFRRVEELETLYLEQANSDERIYTIVKDALFLGWLSFSLTAKQALSTVGNKRVLAEEWIEIVKETDITEGCKSLLIQQIHRLAK